MIKNESSILNLNNDQKVWFRPVYLEMLKSCFTFIMCKISLNMSFVRNFTQIIYIIGN